MGFKNRYNTVSCTEDLKWVDEVLSAYKGNLMFVDTETNGLNIRKNVVIGVSLSIDTHSGVYIPFLKWVPDLNSGKNKSIKKVKYHVLVNGHFECVWTGATFEEDVTPVEYNAPVRVPEVIAYLRKWTENKAIVMHNAPFDVNMIFNSLGFDLKDRLFADTALLLHIVDENESTSLKKAIERYKSQLGLNPHALATKEKQELGNSIIVNGGKPGHVWRASLDILNRYACADTIFTAQIFNFAIEEVGAKMGKGVLDWFFNQEVMPLCREVVIEMKRNGVCIDVPHFKKLQRECVEHAYKLEDEIIQYLKSNGLLDGFNLGKSVDELVSRPRLIKELIRLEGRKIPVIKGKESISKAAAKAEYQKDPHWLWAYIQGETEIPYADARLAGIKRGLAIQALNTHGDDHIGPMKRHSFNVNSRAHLIWLFCTKLGVDPVSLPQTDSATPEKPSPKLDAEVLETIIAPKFKWTTKLLSYKKLLKIESCYARPAVLLHDGGRLFMDFKQNGTTSGRFSCSGGFNLQTLPRVEDEYEVLNECECGAQRLDADGAPTGDIEIIQSIECMADRKCNKCGVTKTNIVRPSAIKAGFIAPPGFKIVNADYSSLEPRCFAFMSNEDSLKEVYSKGLDLYSQVYCQLFDIENKYSADPNDENYLKKVAKAKRKFIKPVVLAIPYGAEDGQVAKLIDAKKSVIDKVTGEIKTVTDYEEGKRIRDLYLNSFPKLNAYMKDMDLKATTQGYVETLFGRRRRFKFAKTISDILGGTHGLDYRDLKRNTNPKAQELIVNTIAGPVCFPREALNDISEALGMKFEDVLTKGGWQYIHALMKHDLNNAKNFPIQGLAGHITNKGMLETQRVLKKNGMDSYVCMQVHDEITLYAKEADANAVAKILKVNMEDTEFTSKLDIPIIAEPTICNSLKDAK